MADINTEKWYQSRRMWAVVLGTAILGARMFLPAEYQEGIINLLLYAGSIYGLSITGLSWAKPKE